MPYRLHVFYDDEVDFEIFLHPLWQACLDAARVARSREKPSPDPAGQDSSFQWAGSTDCSGRATMQSELEPQSTWQQSWSTWLLRSWSWLATLPGTTRSPASSQGIYNLPSGMTRS